MSVPLLPGERTRLGRYELLGRLGEGGMGTVYLGRDRDGRKVAIKMVRPEFSYDAEFRGRFRSEVNRARQVPPFSTAEVLDADPDHDPPYLVVEYVDGPSLAAVVREQGPLSPSALHGVAVGIATALSAIHGAGVIHRDLKPANVLFAMGGIKVIDFGIARAFEATSQHTRTDQIVGTVGYMAPERFEPGNGRQVTSAADIFAWGVVVAYAATGRTPFAADSAPGTAMRILTQPPDLSGLTGPLRDLVDRALVKDPDERPTARALLDALLDGNTPPAGTTAVLASAALAARDSLPVPGGDPGEAQGAARPEKRRRSRLLGVGAAAATLVVLLGVGVAALQALGPRGDDTGGSPATSAPTGPSPTNGRAVPAAPDPDTPILQGTRRTLIHIAEIDRDLALDLHSYEVEASDGTGTKSQFALVPMGVEYLIKSLRGEGRADDSETCLGVKITLDGPSSLVAAACNPTQATLFSLDRTGARDDKNRPTYYLHNETHGFVQWSTQRKAVIVEWVGDATPSSTFSLVDRGAL
ncbi:serine/threonine-protein kinase [Plantactinospora sp. BB1]|uniref:serine/threonine-protein kinase n=1 Tax=Plantactinospora sp. BB1 TaxID=2071627 RepID=UPI000D16AF87|nr:serine/threonine-protein kinase [Plantactinospora sp. BB1]AVT37489.1 serine/threonine protein kinase [Plantactinospora sp. BB1]